MTDFRCVKCKRLLFRYDHVTIDFKVKYAEIVSSTEGRNPLVEIKCSKCGKLNLAGVKNFDLAQV